jgi:Asp-tRNA(Asn)/Glu-tRNA(Gln) amidotransferase A subunit family amidase
MSGELPVGLQNNGRRLDDALVIAAAGAFDRIRPWADRRRFHFRRNFTERIAASSDRSRPRCGKP